MTYGIACCPLNLKKHYNFSKKAFPIFLKLTLKKVLIFSYISGNETFICLIFWETETPMALKNLIKFFETL